MKKRHTGSTIIQVIVALFFTVLIVSAVLRMDTIIDGSHQRTEDYFEMQLASINLAESLIQDIQNGGYILAENHSYYTEDLEVLVSIEEHYIYSDYLYLVTADMQNINSGATNTIQFFLRGGATT